MPPFPPSLRSALLLIFAVLAALSSPLLQAQSSEAMRVTVTMNADGSKTVYETDPGALKTVSTTTEANGKPRGKIIYALDPAGRFASGEVYGADGKLRFTTAYKYNAAGKLEEERQISKAGALLGRIVYRFDAAGRPSGYSTYDAAGTLLRSPASGARPSAPPKQPGRR